MRGETALRKGLAGAAVLLRRGFADGKKKDSKRLREFRDKLRQTSTIEQLEELQGPHPQQEKQPLPPFPNNTNPQTGEVGGPRGPEPTRYGDWERKGRVTDF